jgi:hypothetical protein
MLPGFRFLFAAIVLSVSILIFGLGAAALLRAAHEEFASNPTWRTAAEPRFAQQNDRSQPVLAVLRVEPQPSAQKAPDPQPADVPANLPAPESAVSATPAEPEAVVTSAPGSEKVAALGTPDAPVETARTDAQPAEAPVASDAAPVPAEEAKVATTDEAKPSASEALPLAPEAAESEPANADIVKSEPEPAITPTMPAAASAMTKVATLAIPAVANENTAKEVGEKTEPSVEKARLRAQARARARRRLLARARLLRQQQLAQQQTIGLFGQTSGPTPARTP